MTDTTSTVDLGRFKKSALTKKQLAWKLLKQTRNPEYVGMRYGYPIETMREALEGIQNEQPLFRRLQKCAHDSPAVERQVRAYKSAGEALPEALQRTRVPGEDDDKGS